MCTRKRGSRRILRDVMRLTWVCAMIVVADAKDCVVIAHNYSAHDRNAAAFSAHISGLEEITEVSVQVAQQYSEDTNEDGCNAGWCSSTETQDVCSWCACATCTRCAPTRNFDLGCRLPANVTGCWGADIVHRSARGSAVLRLNPTDPNQGRFGCSVALHVGAQILSPPTLSCYTAQSADKVATSSGLAKDRLHPSGALSPSSSFSMTAADSALSPADQPQAEVDCSTVLNPPHVNALSSASFVITPRLDASHRTQCKYMSQMKVEMRQGNADWQPVDSREHEGSAQIVDVVRCFDTEATRCAFRLRFSNLSSPSQSSAPIAGKSLPPPGSAARVEFGLLLSQSGSVCLTCTEGRGLLTADICAVLRLPDSSFVRVVEVRGTPTTTWVVMDLYPIPGRPASMLAEQLASLVPQSRSELFGGDITQFIDTTLGVSRLGKYTLQTIERSQSMAMIPLKPSEGNKITTLWPAATLLVVLIGVMLTRVFLLGPASYLHGLAAPVLNLIQRSRHSQLSTEENDEDDEAGMLWPYDDSPLHVAVLGGMAVDQHRAPEDVMRIKQSETRCDSISLSGSKFSEAKALLCIANTVGDGASDQLQQMPEQCQWQADDGEAHSVTRL